MINYDYIEKYIQKTLKPENDILAKLRSYAKKNHVPIVHSEVGKLLEVIGKIKSPKNILEIGTAIGYSAILMAEFLSENGKIDTIEHNYKIIEKAKENVKKAKLEEKINIILGDALDVLTCLQKKYDFIFLDASKGQYLEFLPQCLRLLNNGGILFSDNVLYRGMVASDDLVVRRKKTIVLRMREYLDTICNMKELETSVLPIGDGVAISWKK